MTTALAERPDAPLVTAEQMELVKRTVANGATDGELKLFLFDCQRQGVHPLDRLLHFTVRKNQESGERKYTPVTSIDFMRMRAADTGEYAGSDDTVFAFDVSAEPRSDCPPESATVTVYRLVQGQKCSFTATARWKEYKPDRNDFMWRKMPHTMLGKCAEALALRKGFPRQLAGLYAREEMDQAGNNGSFTVEAPASAVSAIPSSGEGRRDNAAAPPAGEPAAPLSLPDGVVLITRVDSGNGRAKGFLFTNPHPWHGGEGLGMYDERLADLARECCQLKTPVKITTKVSTASGKTYVTAIERVERERID